MACDYCVLNGEYLLKDQTVIVYSIQFDLIGYKIRAFLDLGVQILKFFCTVIVSRSCIIILDDNFYKITTSILTRGDEVRLH